MFTGIVEGSLESVSVSAPASSQQYGLLVPFEVSACSPLDQQWFILSLHGHSLPSAQTCANHRRLVAMMSFTSSSSTDSRFIMSTDRVAERARQNGHSLVPLALAQHIRMVLCTVTGTLSILFYTSVVLYSVMISKLTVSLYDILVLLGYFDLPCYAWLSHKSLKM